jgi:hypothetical protein
VDDLGEVTITNNRKSIWPLITFLIILVGFGYFIYSTYLKNPCKVPVKYAIGNVDPRFKISSSDVLNIAEDAANRWDGEIGEQVLSYDPSASLKINLVYDDRQANVDKLNSEVASLDSSGNAIDSARAKLESMVTAYQNDLASYNSEVASWNAKGGAPTDVYNQLQTEKNSLEQRRISINNYTSVVNAQINEHNTNLDQTNNEINASKNKIITSGLYYTANPKIDIFTFGNNEELRLVLMHELGHALSLEHDTINASIMYPILGDQNLSNPVLTSEDIQMFDTTCKSTLAPFTKLLEKFKNLFNPASQTS